MQGRNHPESRHKAKRQELRYIDRAMLQSKRPGKTALVGTRRSHRMPVRVGDHEILPASMFMIFPSHKTDTISRGCWWLNITWCCNEGVAGGLVAQAMQLSRLLFMLASGRAKPVHDLEVLFLGPSWTKGPTKSTSRSKPHGTWALVPDIFSLRSAACFRSAWQFLQLCIFQNSRTCSAFGSRQPELRLLDAGGTRKLGHGRVCMCVPVGRGASTDGSEQALKHA